MIHPSVCAFAAAPPSKIDEYWYKNVSGVKLEAVVVRTENPVLKSNLMLSARLHESDPLVCADLTPVGANGDEAVGGSFCA